MGDRVAWDYPEAGGQVEDGVVRQVLEGLSGIDTPPISLAQTLTVSGVTSLTSLGTAGNVGVGGTLLVTGATTLSSTLEVTGAATLSSTLAVTGAISGASLALTGTLTVGGTSSLKATGVAGNLTVTNAAGTLTRLYADAANGRVLVGTATALPSAPDDAFAVVGRSYFAPATANDSTVSIRRSAASTSGWTIGVENSPVNLAVKDDSDTKVFAFGDAGHTYQAMVTGAAHVSTSLVVGTGTITLGANNQGLRLTETGATVRDSVIMDASNITIFGNSGNSGTVVRGGYVRLQYATTTRLAVNSDGIGFLGADPVARPTVVGTRTGTLAQLQTAFANLCAKLGAATGGLGLITDLTS